MDKLDKLIDQFLNPNPFPHDISEPTWNTGVYAPSVPIKDRRDVDDEEEEEEKEKRKKVGMLDSNLVWACKMVLLDQLDTSQILKEQITHKEKEGFGHFITSLKAEQVMMILELTKEEEGPFKYDVDSTKSVEELGDELKGVLTGKVEVKKRLKIGSRFGIKSKIAIGLGIGTLLAIGAYFIYKRYKDQCRKQCKDSKDSDCLKKCRVIASKVSIAKLQGSRAACGSDQKCITKADKEIRKWQGKMARMGR